MVKIKHRSKIAGSTAKPLATAVIAILLTLILSGPALGASEKEARGLEIVEIIREGEHETVLVLNKTRDQIDLCGYVLKIEGSERVYDFAEESECKTTSPPLSVMRIHSGPGSSSYYASWQDLPWTQEEVWDDEGGKATLVDPDGEVISTYEYGQE